MNNNKNTRSEYVYSDRNLRRRLPPGISSVRELIRICGDVTELIERRVQACTAVGELRPPRAVAALLRAARDRSDDLVWVACAALGKLENPGATKHLIKIARNPQSFTARQAAILALRKLGDPRAKSVLVHTLNNKNELDYIRGLAAQALGMLRPTTESVPVLIQALKDPSIEVRYSSLCGLSATMDDRAANAIKELLSDKGELPGEGTVGDLAKDILRTLGKRPPMVRRGRKHKRTRSYKMRG